MKVDNLVVMMLEIVKMAMHYKINEPGEISLMVILTNK